MCRSRAFAFARVQIELETDFVLVMAEVRRDAETRASDEESPHKRPTRKRLMELQY